MSSICVNIFGGPGIGKSKSASELFAKLKWENIDCDLLHEFAKHAIYEENKMALELQFSLGFNQLYNQMIMMDKTDVIVCDSPFILSNVYSEDFQHLTVGFVKQFNKFRNMNYLLVRDTNDYTEKGRIHTLEQAIELDDKIKKFLDKNKIPYQLLKPDRNTSDKILLDLKMVLKQKDYKNAV